MSGALIRDIQNHAAYEAAQEGKTPLIIWDAEQDARGIPFLGDFVPQGWRHATWNDLNRGRSKPGWAYPRNVYHPIASDEAAFMVDKSGFGSTHEPALTLSELVAYMTANPGYGWAIREEGQFQIVVGIYKEDPSAPGTEAPEPDPCEYCKAIHGPLDECDPDDISCARCGDSLWSHGYAADGPCTDCGDCIEYVSRQEVIE
jgi:hypothetical protein